MPKGKSKFIPFISALVDVNLLLISFFLAKNLLFSGVSPDVIFYNGLILGWIVLWIGISLKFNLYEIPRIFFTHKILSKNLYAIVVFAFLSGGLIFLISNHQFSRLFFTYAILLFTVFIIIWRFVSIYFLKIYRKKGFNHSKVLLVGINENISTLIDKIYLNRNYGFEISGLFTDAKVDKSLENYYKGNLSEIIDYLGNNTIDEIIISLPYHQSKLINDLFRYADNNMIRVRVIPEFSEYLSQSFSIDYI
jgi:undecaprenyl-phosphate galactose phosphotransferase/putative colanic acid biosynthesis UDP-glucose lipid carrier transferase